MRKSKLFQGTLIFFLNILIHLSCAEEPTSPSEEESGPDSEGFTLENTTTIGTGGGTVSSDEFSLIVPAGSFNQQTEIKLSSKEDNSLFGEDAASKLFKLEGLPSDFTTPLRIAVKYDGTLENVSYIAASEETIDEFTGETVTIYDLKDAIDSSGFLVGYLEASTAPGNYPLNLHKKTDSEIDKRIQAIEGNKMGELGHFFYKCPKSLESAIKPLSDILEENYDIITNSLKIPVEVLGRKITVEITSTDKDYAITFNQNDKLIIDRNNIAGFTDHKPEIKLQSGKHLLQIAIEYRYSSFTIPQEHLWLALAINAWAEELFSTPGSFTYPIDFDKNPWAPFNGIRFTDKDITTIEDTLHGIGMSALLKFLFNNNKLQMNQVGEIYELINQGKDPATALIETINGLKADWWPDFFIHFVSGEIYNVSSDVFIENPDGEWNIGDDNDVLKVLGPEDPEVGTYPDLSAKRFLVNLNHQNIDETKNLNISIEGEAGSEGLCALVFSYKDGDLKLEGKSSSGRIEIQGIRNYYNNGIKQFLIVAVNSTGLPPYENKSNVYLTLKVEAPSSNELNYKYCHLNIDLDNISGTSKNLETGETVAGGESPAYLNSTLNLYWYTGSFTGNTFIGSGSAEVGNHTETGEVTVTLNNSQDTVTSFKLIYEEKFTNDVTGQNTINIEFKAENIPLGDQQGIYEVYNSEVCDHVISLNYHSINDLYENIFDQFNCGNNGFTDKIKLEFEE